MYSPLTPDEIRTILETANTLFDQKKVVEAEAVLREAVASRQIDPAVLYRLGTIAMRQRKFHPARTYFELAACIAPKSHKYLIALGDALLALGCAEEASKAYAWSLTARQTAHGYYMLGTAFEQAGRPFQAILAARKAYELEPSNGNYLHRLHSMNLSFSRPVQASPLGAKLLEMANIPASAFYQAALAELLSGDLETAEALADRAYRQHLDKRFHEADFSSPAMTKCLAAAVSSSSVPPGPWLHYAFLQREHRAEMRPGRIEDFFINLPIKAQLVSAGPVEDDHIPLLHTTAKRNGWPVLAVEGNREAVARQVMDTATADQPIVLVGRGVAHLRTMTELAVTARASVAGFIGLFDGEGLDVRADILELLHNNHFSLFIDQHFFLAACRT